MVVLIQALMVAGMIMAATAGNAKAASTQDTVVLLHGIGHSRLNMMIAERALRKQGYETLNISYPSRRYEINALADFVHERLELAGVWDKDTQVHFVTHSMGGLVARAYLEKYKAEIPREKLGRVVMMAPPNGGSEVADLLQDFLPYQWAFGPAGQELTTFRQSENKTAPYYDLGIIAGTTAWPYFVAAFVIPGQSDGRVALERTKLNGMKDFVALPATHSFISWKPDVHEQLVYFLKEGEFSHGK